MDVPQNIIIAGIAGQGIIFCSEVLCNLIFSENFFLKKCDSYGFAQRGGGVVSQIRIDKNPIFSSTIYPQECTQFILLHEGQRKFAEEMLSFKGKIYEISLEEELLAQKNSIDLLKIKNIYLLSKLLSQLNTKLLRDLQDFLKKNLSENLWIQNRNAFKLLDLWHLENLSFQTTDSLF